MYNERFILFEEKMYRSRRISIFLMNLQTLKSIRY